MQFRNSEDRYGCSYKTQNYNNTEYESNVERIPSDP